MIHMTEIVPCPKEILKIKWDIFKKSLAHVCPPSPIEMYYKGLITN